MILIFLLYIFVFISLSEALIPLSNRDLIRGFSKNKCIENKGIEGDLPSDSELKDFESIMKSERPPEWKIRLDIMGFTPLTYAGFGVAFILLFLNTALGSGWASRSLGWDDTGFTIESISENRDERSSSLNRDVNSF